MDKSEQEKNVEERFLNAATAGDGCLAKHILDELPKNDWKTFLEHAAENHNNDHVAGQPSLQIYAHQLEQDKNPDHLRIQLLKARNEKSFPELIISAAVDTKTGESLGDGINSINSNWPNRLEPFCKQSER